jgi:hypothetical protein
MRKSVLKRLGIVPILLLTLGAWTCSNSSWQKVGELAKDSAATALAAQESEIALHSQGFIDQPTHVTLQQKFSQLSDAGQRLDAAINQAHNGGDATAALNAALAATNDLISNGLTGIKNPDKQAQLKLALLAVQTTLNNVALFAGQAKGTK